MRYIEKGKLSKKKQAEINKKARGMWVRSPITKTVGNGKAYNRNVIKRENREI